jgi:hypothetical protein
MVYSGGKMKEKNLMCISVVLTLSIAIVIMGNALPCEAQTETPTLSVSPPEIVRQIGIGDNFTIEITGEDINFSLSGDTIGMSLEWDPKVLNVTSVDKMQVGSFFVDYPTGYMTIPGNIGPGWADLPSIAVDTAAGNVGSGVLYTVEFQVVGYGSTSINFIIPSIVHPPGNEIIPAVNNGSVTLMSKFTKEVEGYIVEIDSNSTISGFNFDRTNMEISFNVTGVNGAIGYCNATIPKGLLSANDTCPWRIFVNGMNITDRTIIHENATHTFIDFTYSHSTQKVQIMVIPEFPAALMLPLLMIITIVAVVLRKKLWFRKPRVPVVA